MKREIHRQGSSLHKGNVVTTWLKTQGRLKLFYHPPYHPELNLKKQLSRKRTYRINYLQVTAGSPIRCV
jgi:hypothetical protein